MGGLNDASRYKEVLNPMEATNFTFGGIGQSTNYLMGASRYAQGWKVGVAGTNRNYKARVNASYASGILANGWAFAAQLAFRFSLPVSEWLSGYVTMEPKPLQLIAFILVALLSVLVLVLIGKLITHTLKLASLGWLNRLLGVVFALLKAALIIGLLIFIFDSFNAKWGLIKPETLGESPVYIALRDAAMKVFPYLQSLITNVQ